MSTITLSRHTGLVISFRFIDPLVLVLVMVGIGWLRWGHAPEGRDLLPLYAMLPTAMVVFELAGVYRAMRRPQLWDWLGRLTMAMLTVAAVLAFLGFATKTSGLFSRAVLLGWLMVGTLVLATIRSLAFAVRESRLRRGIGVERVAVVGNRDLARRMVEHLVGHPHLGWRPALVAGPDSDELADLGCPTGRGDDLKGLVEQHRIERVVIAAEVGEASLIEDVVSQLVDVPIPIDLAPDFGLLPIFSTRSADCAGKPLVALAASPLSESAQVVKWLEDKILGSLILIGVAPLMALIAILVKTTSPGPVLYIQQRHGLGGRSIRVYKFRTMYTKERPSPPVEDEEPTTDFHQATTADPRITPLGSFLRKTSLDELPQFWNVVKGDMSIVGPRPHDVRHNRQFAGVIEDLMRRHYVKPGITGLAQVNGARGETRTVDDMRRRIEYDLEYITHWSLWLDLRIIIKTVFVGFFNAQP